MSEKHTVKKFLKGNFSNSEILLRCFSIGRLRIQIKLFKNSFYLVFCFKGPIALGHGCAVFDFAVGSQSVLCARLF